MRKIVLASHGELADGLKHTLQFFAGDSVDITTICAYVDAVSIEEKIESFFAGVKEEDEVLIFTDLLGGSVNRAFLPYIKKAHVHVITGMFLGVILELIFKKEGYLSDEEVSNALNKSKESIVYMNNYSLNFDSDDE